MTATPPALNLYLISLTDAGEAFHPYYDHIIEALVWATNETEARQLLEADKRDGHVSGIGLWLDPALSSCTLMHATTPQLAYWMLG